MRSLLVLFLCGILGSLYAQVTDTTGKVTCIDPFDCTNNLVNHFSDLDDASTSILTVTRSYAKSTEPDNYHDVSYIDYTGSDPNCTTTADGCTIDHSAAALMYQVFYPKKYKSCSLPVVIVFHGGGFADCNGSYQGNDIKNICTEFAQRGFVAISAEYRLGVEVVKTDPATKINSPYSTVEQMLAIWRAGQDARGAIRSIIKREGSEPFHINTDEIFLAGNSAGSVVAMNVAFYTVQGMLASAFPSNISTSKVLGSITQDYYFGETNIPFKIAGVLDLWGGILLPNPYTLDESASNLNPPEKFFFQTSNVPPPVIAFCGKLDDVFPITGQPLIFPPTTVYKYQADYISTNVCLNDITGATYYSVTANVSYGNIMGSQNIYEMLKKQNVYSELYIDCQMKHGLDNDCTKCLPGKKVVNGMCTKCYFSDFGVSGSTDPTKTTVYIVQRAATFFQNIMNGKTYTDYATTKFVECPNYRNSCSDAANMGSSCPTDANSSAQTCSN